MTLGVELVVAVVGGVPRVRKCTLVDACAFPTTGTTDSLGRVVRGLERNQGWHYTVTTATTPEYQAVCVSLRNRTIAMR